MTRRNFISNTCVACLGGAALSNLLSGCASTHYVTGQLESTGIAVPVSEFEYIKKKVKNYRQFIIVHHDRLEFPIYLFRTSETDFHALLMKCMHQGSELNASGDYLYCSSHGSEYDKNGNVTHGPAEKKLRTFPVSVQNEKIIIQLTKA